MSESQVLISLMMLLIVTKVLGGHQQLPDLHEKLGEILKWCFAEQLSPVIATTDLIDTFHGPMWDDDSVELIQIDEHFDPGKSQWIHRQWPTFALTVDSEETLEFLLQKLKDSTYWNIKSKLFIVSDKGVCGDASKMLQVAWKMKLLSAFYLCHDAKGNVSLYTFNPFTDRAPHLWNEVKNVGDRWTLYKRLYSEGHDFCHDLDYDKTKFLDGYEVKTIAESRTGASFEENKDYDAASLKEHSHSLSHYLFVHVWTPMNVTLVINYNKRRLYYNGTITEALIKIMNGSYDIAISFEGISYYQREFNVSLIYPLFQPDIAILTRHRNFLTPAEKIANYYTIEIISLTIVVLVITWLIFLVRMNGQRVQAFLEILRMVVSTGLLQKLERTPIRIYLFGVLWLILILNATFQGNLAAFLTKPERHDINSVKDLEVHDYDIYIQKSLYKIMPLNILMSIPKNKIHFIDGYNCFDYVVNNSKAACIHGRIVNYAPANRYNLHISGSTLATPYVTYWHHKDWPLSDKFNDYYFRLMESGLLDNLVTIQTKIPMDKLKSAEEKETAPVIRALTVADLSFAYPILAVGLIISTMIFIVELRGWKGKVRPEVANQSISYRGRFKMRNNIIIGYRDHIEKFIYHLELIRIAIKHQRGVL